MDVRIPENARDDQFLPVRTSDQGRPMSAERVYLRDGRLIHAQTIHRPEGICRQNKSNGGEGLQYRKKMSLCPLHPRSAPTVTGGRRGWGRRGRGEGGEKAGILPSVKGISSMSTLTPSHVGRLNKANRSTPSRISLTISVTRMRLPFLRAAALATACSLPSPSPPIFPAPLPPVPIPRLEALAAARSWTLASASSCPCSSTPYDAAHVVRTLANKLKSSVALYWDLGCWRGSEDADAASLAW